MKISLVKQEDNLGCMIACAAMIADCSYREARDAIAPDWSGASPPDSFRVFTFLKERGWEIICKGEHFYPALKHEGGEFDWPPAPFADLHLVSVVPFGEMGFRHAVLMMRDGTVIDPAKDKPCLLSDYPHVEQVRSVVRAS